MSQGSGSKKSKGTVAPASSNAAAPLSGSGAPPSSKKRATTALTCGSICCAVLAVIVGVSVVTQLPYLYHAVPDTIELLGPHYLGYLEPHISQVRYTPTVLNVPWLERLDFWFTRLPTLVLRMFTGQPAAFVYATQDHEVQPTPDALFNQMYTNDWCSAVTEPLANPNLINFVTLKTGPDMEHWVANFTRINSERRLTGMFGVNSLTVFERKKGEKVGHVLAIQLQYPDGTSTVFKPGDKAWDAAKLFVNHGAVHYLVFLQHPNMHFPMDIVNAFTKHLPFNHPIRQLLVPHFRYSLALDDLVSNSYLGSVIVNPYLPIFCVDGDGPSNLEMFDYSYWNLYDFEESILPKRRIGDYDTYLHTMFAPYEKFVRALVNYRSNEFQHDFRDRFAVSWANDIHQHVLNFPTGEDIVKGDTLIRTLALVMFDVSMRHGADHVMYANVDKGAYPLNQKPWRIRRAPPRTANEDWNFKGAHTWWDMFTYHLTNEVIFFLGPKVSIVDVKYRFTNPEYEKLGEVFKADLKQAHDLYLKTRVTEVDVPLTKIGPSIDY